MLLLVCSGLACDTGRFSPSRPVIGSAGPGNPDNDGLGSSTQLLLETPIFDGIGNMIPGDGTIFFSWDAATDNNDDPSDIFYRVYLAIDPGDQDFTTPDFETAPGQTQLSVTTFGDLTSFTNDVPVYAVVRAVDTEGNEDPNTAEWPATPNPVFYVAPGGGGDGSSPATPAGDINSATFSGSSINIYIAGGLYAINVLLGDGQMLFGGFDSTFDVTTRDPGANITEVSTVFSGPTGTVLINSPSGTQLNGIDGLVLTGNGVNPPATQNITVGIEKDNGFLRVTNCELRNFSDAGVKLANTTSIVPILGYIRNCFIHDIGGEAVSLRGAGSVFIDNNRIEDCLQEGIEAQSLLADALVPSAIEITRNVIERINFEGIDLDILELDPLNPALSQGARVRILVRNNQISNTGTEPGTGGVNIDIDFQGSDGIDFRARVEDNKIFNNDGYGVNIDADAVSSFRIARNVITANQGFGVLFSGTLGGPVVRLLNNRIMGNVSGGIAFSNRSFAEVRHCLLLGNGGPAIVTDRAEVEVSNSIILRNGGPFDATRVRYSLIGDGANAALGAGIIDADPLFLNEPSLTTFSNGVGPGGTLNLADTSLWQVGDTVEIDDDDIVRVVTSVTATSIVVDPQPTATTQLTFVANYLDSDSVVGDDGFQSGSAAIDAGDIVEEDRDDNTLPDLGPSGGFTPGNVGIETGVAAESAALEVIAITPTPGSPQLSSSWALSFNRDVDPNLPNQIRLRVNDVLQPLNALSGSVAADTLSLTASAAFNIGDKITLELFPTTTIDPAFEPLASHILLETYFGNSATDSDGASETNGSPATAQGVPSPARISGSIGFLGDIDVYRVSLVAGQALRTDLVAGGIESTLLGRVTLLGTDGASVLLSQDMAVPAPVDALLPPLVVPVSGDYFVRIEAINGGLSVGQGYVLILDVR